MATIRKDVNKKLTGIEFTFYKSIKIGVRKSYKKMDIKIAFTDKEITPWSGTLLLKKMLDRMNIDDQLDKLPFPLQGSNRGYPPNQLIKQSVFGVAPINLSIAKLRATMKC
ncbi:MAG: hypothetical protein EKK39_02770 [Sphingobacteriales bacterium]|uniref:hypothetical protein n=1 Tax=Hydrotalea flava TaxID=714549 RepID=UPI000FC00662|nr:hypothetical protein [Hydrotalea flava]RTL55525.1 MAG: hypothetical protein EKK39_02770 [Sphingobacteriales bacterium]